LFLVVVVVVVAATLRGFDDNGEFLFYNGTNVVPSNGMNGDVGQRIAVQKLPLLKLISFAKVGDLNEATVLQGDADKPVARATVNSVVRRASLFVDRNFLLFHVKGCLLMKSFNGAPLTERALCAVRVAGYPNAMYMTFGGADRSMLSNDVTAFDVNGIVQLKSQSKLFTPRYGASCLQMYNGVVAVIGGVTETSALSIETFRFAYLGQEQKLENTMHNRSVVGEIAVRALF
jgi:hypothetical protein